MIIGSFQIVHLDKPKFSVVTPEIIGVTYLGMTEMLVTGTRDTLRHLFQEMPLPAWVMTHKAFIPQVHHTIFYKPTRDSPFSIICCFYCIVLGGGVQKLSDPCMFCLFPGSEALQPFIK